jgi:hypothetical protein
VTVSFFAPKSLLRFRDIIVRVTNPQRRTSSFYITTSSEGASYFHKIASRLQFVGRQKHVRPMERLRNVTLSHNFPKKRAKTEQVVRK